jgi:hypothetical protein
VQFIFSLSSRRKYVLSKEEKLVGKRIVERERERWIFEGAFE